MSKKEVIFTEVGVAPLVGDIAIVVADEHHTLGVMNPDMQVIRTSEVMAVNFTDGSFETRNSIYKPATPEVGELCVELAEARIPKSQRL